MKEVIEGALATKLEHIKGEKNAEISRLHSTVTALKDELGNTLVRNEGEARESRNQLIGDTENRISNVRRLGQLIEETLVEEINNLNESLRKKNDHINFLTESDKKQL